MKRLHLLRHAKAGWSVDVVHDFRRPLEERGRQDAAAPGALLTDLGQEPDGVPGCGRLAWLTTPGIPRASDRMFCLSRARNA